MKILKVKRSDMNDAEAERKFYALYTPTKEMIKKNVDKMYSILYQLKDSTIKKQQELVKEMGKDPTTRYMDNPKYWENLSSHFWNDYPDFQKRKQEIDRMKQMAEHLQFMINELGLVRKW